MSDEEIPTRVSKLDASLVGKRIQLNGQIVSEKRQKALPAKLKISCSRCKEQVELDLTDRESKNLLESVIFKDKQTLRMWAEAFFIQEVGAQCLKRPNHKIFVEEEDVTDYAVLGLRDLLEETEKFDQQVFQSRRVHLVGAKVPNAKKVTLEGYVSVNPSSRDICIIADTVKPLETQVTGFIITAEDRTEWPKYFNDEAVIVCQIAPDMVGREVVQLSYLLLLHSVPEIPDIYGRKIRGCLRVLALGDTKTYKTEGAKDLTNHYGFGGYIMAESSSRTGITYTIDNEEKAIVWGELPNNDLGLTVIDGLHVMFGEEMKELREALESQRITVRRSVSGDALARTRVIGILNPNKPMNQYMYAGMAIKDTVAFVETADITRWDIILPFAIDDVSKDKIARRMPAERPIPEETFKRHVYWAWSRKLEHIVYTEEAKGLIIEAAVELMEEYSISDLPIVHLGVRDILCRLSVSQAALNHSTDEKCEKVIVRLKDVQEALEFYEAMLDLLSLSRYKDKQEGDLQIQLSEVQEIVQDLGEVEMGILNSIIIHSKSSATLAEEFDLSARTIKEHYKPLRKHKLINAAPRVGISLSARGVKFLKLLTPGISEVVKKPFTNKGQASLMVKKNVTTSPIPSVGEKIKFVLDKCRELAVDGLVSKFAVADALEGRVDRNEVFQLLEILDKKEGKLAAKGPEWYVV